MKKCYLLRATISATFAALLVCLAAPDPVRAADEAAAPAPLKASASLATAATVTLGEPVVMQFGVTNTSDQKIGVNWGDNDTGWYSLALTDDQGVPAAPIPPEQVTQPMGYHMTRDPFIFSGGVNESYLVVTKLFRVTHPGKYALTMHVNLPYRATAATEEDPLALKKSLKAGADTLSQDVTLSFSVTNADSGLLKAAAEALHQKISTHPWGDLNSALTTALFSMPEAAAAASWQALTDKPGMSSGLYASELKRLGTPTAADMLAGMLANPAPSSDDKAYVGQCLNEMYNAGTPALRTHIRQIAAAHGLSLPEHIAIPVASD